MNRFLDISNWIFDLDNTLYPAARNLFSQIDQRMGSFIADYLQVNLPDARKIQKQYFKEHGTTLNGLMTVHGICPHDFLHYVHDIDHSVIDQDPALDSALQKIHGRKVVFTNGTTDHASAVLDQIGIAHHFDEIYDIVSTDYQPKPFEDAYRRVLTLSGLEPRKTAMFEDIARNLEVPYSLGMTTVLVRSQGSHPDEGLGLTGQGDEDFIDHVTEDLTAFLQVIADHRHAETSTISPRVSSD